MNFFKLIKNNKSIRRITIIMFIGWLFFIASLMYVFHFMSNTVDNYEVEQLIHHYEDVFSEYNNEIELINAYLENNSDVFTEDDFMTLIQSIVGDDVVVKYASVAPAGIVKYVYPLSMKDEYLDLDIMGEATIYQSAELLDAITNQELIYQYLVDGNNVTELLMRRPIIVDDEFYGFVTIALDANQFATNQFAHSSDYLNSSLFTEEGKLIYGNGSMEDYSLHPLVFYGETILIGETLDNTFIWRAVSVFIGFALTMFLTLIFILVITYKDKMALRGYMTELTYRQNYDTETDLYNTERLYNDVSELTSKKDEFYLAFLNINNVKYINDKFGHLLTTELMKKTTGMISRVLRQNAKMYRYGGDEYVVVIESDSTSEVKNLLRRIVKLFDTDITTSNIRARLGIAIGVANFPSHGYKSEELIKNAHLSASQLSTYDSKGFAFYQKEHASNILHNQDFDKFVSSLNLDLFEVHLMPIIEVQTNRITGFECLSRAFDDLGNSVDIEDVVLSLERHGKIQILDESVFKRMLIIMKRMNKEFPEEDLFLSLNASALSLNDEYVDNVIRYYKQAKLKKGQIVLELTESYQVEDYDYLVKLFKRLNESGIKIAIDDFGSGYSSISYISKFPIYAIKVDKEYVRDYHDNNFNKTLLMTLKSIAEVLDCKLVAEGVDSHDTLEFLKEFDCPFYQGYLFSKGVPFDDAMALLKNNLSKNIE